MTSFGKQVLNPTFCMSLFFSKMAECPYGFVIPDEPDNPLTVYPNRTMSECAFSCVEYPIYTRDEYHDLEVVRTVAQFVSFSMSTLVLLYHTYKWQKSKELDQPRYELPSFLLLTYGAVISVCMLGHIIINQFGTDRLCANNANPMDGHDGLSLCSFEAAAVRVTYGSCTTCFCYYSLESFYRIMWRYRGALTNPQIIFRYCFVFGIPLAGAFVGIITGSYRYAVGFQGCDVTVPNDIDYAVYHIPMLLFLTIGELSLLVICGKIIYLTALGQLSSFFAGLKMVGTAFKFMFLTGGFLLAAVVTAASMQNKQHNRTDETEEWGRCVIANYDGSTTASYSDICGSHPQRDYSPNTLMGIVAFGTAGLGVTYFLLNVKLEWFSTHQQIAVSPGELPVSKSRETLPMNALPVNVNTVRNSAAACRSIVGISSGALTLRASDPAPVNVGSTASDMNNDNYRYRYWGSAAVSSEVSASFLGFQLLGNFLVNRFSSHSVPDNAQYSWQSASTMDDDSSAATHPAVF